MDKTRRDFVKLGSLTGLAAFALAGTASCTGRNTETGSSYKNGNQSVMLAGLSPGQLHVRLKDELFNRFLPAMEELCIDHEYGGFMCDADIRNRKMLTTNKKTWYQGRGIWVYSFLYNNFDRNPRYLEIAKDAIDFILPLKPAGDNFWTDLHSREGDPLSGPGDIYGNLFVAEGLAEYSIASGDPQYLKLAKDIIFHCLERYDRPDYIYNISYAPGNPEIKGPRVLGHWMIFLSLSSQILNHEYDPAFEKLADRCIKAILDNHMNSEFLILNEVINHDLTLPDNEYAQFAVIGHGIETLAFIIAEAVRRKDDQLLKRSGEAFRRHVEVAADKLYGGYFEILYNANDYRWAQSKSAWCQQETLTGALMLYEQYGDEWARNCYSELDTWVQDKMVCRDFAFWTFGGDRKVSKPNTRIIEHYHTPRYLMRNMLALQSMIKNGS
jgi:mannose/cellobiose epimerase-like protein (N-acyl-D-glucosamine 2-epimerase family)